MTIDRKYIERLQNLSELEFTDEELNNFVKDFEEITNFFKKIDIVDVGNIDKKKIVEITELRDDIVLDSLNREEVLKNAPNRDSISLIVPKVVE